MKRIIQFAERCRTLKHTLIAYQWWAEVAIRSTLGLKRNNLFSSRRHLALLAWGFPPYVTAGTYRPAALAKHGAAMGWRISVVCRALDGAVTPAGDYLLRKLPTDLKALRVEQPKLEPSWNFYPYVNGGFVNALATVSVARRFFDTDPPSVVMASGPPFFIFIAGYYLARRYGAKLVLDYRDEWSEGTPAFVECGPTDRKWEIRCLRQADAVIFVAKSILDLYAAAFPELDIRKCKAIRNGWDPEDFLAVTEAHHDFKADANTLLIPYLGFVSGNMLPGSFLETLKVVLERRPELRRCLKVAFVGRCCSEAMQQLARFPYPDVLKVVDEYLPKPAAIRMMQESTALLLLNEPKHARVLPVKFYEYLAAGQPVLVYGDTGELGEVVRKLNAGLLVPMDDPNALERALDTLANDAPKVDRVAISDWLEEHTRKMMATRMVEVLDEVIR